MFVYLRTQIDDIQQKWQCRTEPDLQNMKQVDKNEATCLRLFQYKIPLIILADHFELDNDQSSVETSHAFIVSLGLP